MKMLLAVIAFAVAALAPHPAAADTAVSPIAFHVRTLPNGLKLYTVLDRTRPDVTVQVWYGVGAKDDPPGRSGFAHLFEHLMFKGTRDMPPEFMSRLTDDVGGTNNASTDNDFTEYHEVVPPGQLAPVLWAEAERMASLVVDPASFVAERAVVEDELRERVLADPYGRLFAYDIPSAAFAAHPYGRATIGRVDDLEAASLADVRAFHALYYRPDNASLVVAGNFDPAQLDAWVDQYFGPIARPAAPIPQVTAQEPARTGPRTVDAYGPEAPTPAIALTFAGPPAASPDAAAAQVLVAILATGDAARLNVSLVYRQRLASEVFADADLWRLTGLIDVGAELADGVSLARGEAALRAELADLREHPVAAAELSRAKNQLLAALLEDRETIDGVAFEIGQAAVVEGDAARANSDVTALQAVTAADVRRVARTWLVDDRRVTVRYHAGPARAPAAIEAASDAVAVSRDLSTSLGVTVDADTTPPSTPRERPPTTGPADEPVLPRPLQRTLTNGLTVIVARTGASGVATASLALRGGSALDPPGKAGLADMTASLAAQGWRGISALDLATMVEGLGDSLTAKTDYDASSFTLTGLAATLPQALPILGNLVRRPPLGAGALGLVRQDDADSLVTTLHDPDSLADFAVAPLVFGQGPYGHATTGPPQALARISHNDVLRRRALTYRPDNAVLVVTGDVVPEAVFALADRAFGDWARPSSDPPSPPREGPSPSGRTVVVDLPDAPEATVVVAGRSIGRLDPSYYAVEVANAVLGGSYSSRLNDEIRIKRGLTYDASSQVDELAGAGLFWATAETESAQAPKTAALMLGQLAALGAQPPSAEELAARKAALIGDFGRETQSSEDFAALLVDDAIHGVDVDHVGRYPARIEAVTGAEVQAASARLADPAALDVLVIGDAGRILPALKSGFPAAEVIPAKALDLTSASLR